MYTIKHACPAKIAIGPGICRWNDVSDFSGFLRKLFVCFVKSRAVAVLFLCSGTTVGCSGIRSVLDAIWLAFACMHVRVYALCECWIGVFGTGARLYLWEGRSLLFVACSTVCTMQYCLQS